MKNIETTSKSTKIGFIAVSLYSLLQFFLQVSGNLIASDLGIAFHINEWQVGVLCSVYFGTLLLTQLPAGILLDFFGAKRILVISSIILSLGCIAFSMSHTFWQAIASRLLMGAGAGFGFIGMVFVVADSFPMKLFGIMLGLGELIGMLGTAVGQYVSPFIILKYGWRVLMILVAIFVLLSSILMAVSLSTKSHRIKKYRGVLQQSYQALLTIIKNKLVWQSGIFGLGTFLILTAFVDIWAVPFFEHVYGFSYLYAAQLLTIIILGIACGGPILGKIADNAHNPKNIMLFSTLVAMLAMTALIYFPLHNIILLGPLLFILGFFSSVYLLAFLLVRIDVESNTRGTALAFCNVLELLGAVLFQPLIGILLTALKTVTLHYQLALTSIAVMLSISLAFLLAIKVPGKGSF